MTNSTIPAEPAAAPSSAASFFRWEVSDKPIAIYLDLELVDRLEREILETFKAIMKRGSEIGGVMAGRVLPGPTKTVTIEHFEPVECSYSRGPLYLLSDEDKEKLKQAIGRVSKLGNGLCVTGFFRSNTRRELILDEDDQALAAEYFSDPNHVFMLVRPYAMKPSIGTFFFREQGKMLGESNYLEFPFKRAELLKSFAQYIVGAPEQETEAAPAKEPLVMPRREERHTGAAVVSKPLQAPPPAPAGLKREEPKPSIVPSPKREEASPISFRREERPAIVPVMAKREERPPAIPVQPKREERVTKPTLVSRHEEPSAPAAKMEDKPAAPVSAKREERPQVAVKREEKLAPPKPAEIVTPAAKREEVAEPMAPMFASAGEAEAGPGLFSRFKWAIIAVVILVMAVGAWFAFQGLRSPAQQAKQPDSLSLRVERNAGQYILSWDRNSTLIATANRATLSITDGDHKEDVDLDLNQLRTGNIVYSPMTNDVSFALEVADTKHGKSVKESTRVLGARPSPTVAALPPSAASPAPGVPGNTAAAQPQPQASKTEAPPEQPKVVAGPVVTAAPAQPQSLAARLRAADPQEMPAPPTLESSSTALTGNAPALGGAPQVAPPAAQMPAAPPKQAPAQAQPAQRTAAPAQAQQAQRTAAAAPAKGGQVHEARLIKRVQPSYPAMAQHLHISGTVRVQAMIGKDGRVKSTSVLTGPPLLRQAAADAVRHWLYSPALLDGEPVETETQVDVSFMM